MGDCSEPNPHSLWPLCLVHVISPWDTGGTRSQGSSPVSMATSQLCDLGQVMCPLWACSSLKINSI